MIVLKEAVAHMVSASIGLMVGAMICAPTLKAQISRIALIEQYAADSFVEKPLNATSFALPNIECSEWVKGADGRWRTSGAHLGTATIEQADLYASYPWVAVEKKCAPRPT